MSRKITAMGLGLLFTLMARGQSASPPVDDNHPLKGDVGLAVYRTPPITRSTGDANVILPYAFAEYEKFFARVDTFGLKLLPMGTGNLELSARVSFEGYKPVGYKGIQNRSTPLPVGLSTYQETPNGAFFAHGFYDANSGGTLLDVSYAAEFKLGSITVYPQLGFERRSASYVRHLYGVSPQENADSGFSVAVYNPGNSISPNLGFAIEYPLMNDYSLTLQVRKKWLDKSITDSPLVASKSQVSSFLSLARSFK